MQILKLSLGADELLPNRIVSLSVNGCTFTLNFVPVIGDLINIIVMYRKLCEDCMLALNNEQELNTL